MLLSPPCFSIILCYFLLILVFFFSVDISNDDPIWGKDLTLSVNTSGHILHAFVNGEHIGNFGYGYGFVVSSEVDYYPTSSYVFFTALRFNFRIPICITWTV